MATCGILLAMAIAFSFATATGEFESGSAPPDLAAHGRQVYISEGCIHCHSRYVRPSEADVEMWGPWIPSTLLSQEEPPLIGNRRQGPDLLNVGLRRSSAWLQQHFLAPRSLSPGSSMPTYTHLFADDRGDALIQFLMQPQPGAGDKRIEFIQSWRPPGGLAGNREAGAKLFEKHCATCHTPGGALAKHWTRAPADLSKGPFLYSQARGGISRNTTLRRIMRFGIMGTDMPGHEYFSPTAIADLAVYVESLADQVEP